MAQFTDAPIRRSVSMCYYGILFYFGRMIWIGRFRHFFCLLFYVVHYGDVTMGAMASQITSLTIVYSTVYSDADQRKHQSSASLAFVCGEFTGDRWIPRTNGQ